MNDQKRKPNAKIVCIIQARMGSSRLPGKVLKEICGYPMLDWVVHRAKNAAYISTVLVATTLEHNDDAIAKWCQDNAVPCYRGAAQDVLDRFYRAAKTENADVIVRLTADCPLIDPHIIDDVIDLFFVEKADFAANRLPPPFSRTFPIGLDVEVVSFSALEKAWHAATKQFEREHVLPYLYAEDGRFHISVLDAEKDFGALRWTVDTPADLKFLCTLMERLKCNREISWLSILDHIQTHPELMEINADVVHKSFTDIDQRANQTKDYDE